MKFRTISKDLVKNLKSISSNQQRPLYPEGPSSTLPEEAVDPMKQSVVQKKEEVKGEKEKGNLTRSSVYRDVPDRLGVAEVAQDEQDKPRQQHAKDLEREDKK